MIDLAKVRAALPLPELMAKLGLAEHAKAKAHCPWHDDKTPSFGIFEKEGRWWFKCQAGCGTGDEVDFLQKALAIATKGEAIRQYASMAGVTSNLSGRGNGLQPLVRESQPATAQNSSSMTPGKFVRDVTDVFPGAAVVPDMNFDPPYRVDTENNLSPVPVVAKGSSPNDGVVKPRARGTTSVSVVTRAANPVAGDSNLSGGMAPLMVKADLEHPRKDTGGETPAQNNLSAVPALAKPEPSTRPTDRNRRVSGDTRESARVATPKTEVDSRGGAQSLTPASIKKLAEWRGLSLEFVEGLAERRVVVTIDNQIAFPVPGGFHYRLKDGSWRYTQGAKPDLFTPGELEEGAHVHCFESPWDALTYADTIADSLNNIVATRGSQNARLLADRLRGHAGTLYLWPQKDEPGRKWMEDIRKLLPDVQMKLVNVPNAHKDLNEWRKAGATDNQILGARLDATDFIASGAGRTGRETEPTTLAPTNFSVPALAELGTQRPVTVAIMACDRPITGSHPDSDVTKHARESARNKHSGATLNLSGGESNLSGGVESRHAGKTQGRLKPEAEVPQTGNGDERLESGQDKSTKAAATCNRGGGFATASSGSSAPPAQNSQKGGDAPWSESHQSMTVLDARSNVAPNVQPAGAADISLAQTLDSVVEFLKRYVVFAYEEQAIACALWLAHTWVYDAFDYSPILHIHAPDRGCGKSILLESVGLLSCRPELFVNTSETALFREINELHPTLLWDEIDNFLIDDMSPILGMLNAGYKRGGKVKRNADFGARREKFDVFCPKALTGIRKIHASLQSRSLSIRLNRARKGTGIKFRTKRAEPESLPIISALQAWAINAKPVLSSTDVELPDEVDGRQQDILEPLLAVARMAGPEWYEKGHDALMTLARALEDSSTGEQLLSSCREVFDGAGQDKISTIELLKRLVSIESANAPWAGWWEANLARGNTHTPGGKLAKLLKPYGIQPRSIRFDGDEIHKGYAREDFEDAWKDYLPEKSPAGKADDETMTLGL